MHTIELHGPVGGDTFHAAMLGDLPPEPLHLLIDSNGGDSVHWSALFVTIRQHAEHFPVSCFIRRAASAAVPVALACDHRTIGGGGSIFLHRSQAVQIGDCRDLIAAARSMAKHDRRYQALVADRTGEAVSTIRDLCDNDTTLSSSEAVRLGFAHEITGEPIEPTVDRGTGGKRRLGTLDHVICSMSPDWSARRKQAAPLAALAPGATDRPEPEPWPETYRDNAAESLARILEARRRKSAVLYSLRGPASYSDHWPRPVHWTCHCGASNSHAPENELGFSTPCRTCDTFYPPKRTN